MRIGSSEFGRCTAASRGHPGFADRSLNDNNDFWSRIWRDGSIASALAGLAITAAVAAAKTAFTDPEGDYYD